jgi:hypothetical protein
MDQLNKQYKFKIVVDYMHAKIIWTLWFHLQ